MLCRCRRIGSTDDLKGMFHALHDVDGVIASRRLKESKILIMQQLREGWQAKLLIFLSGCFLVCPSKIPNVVQRSLRDAIHDILDDLKTSGFEIDVEILGD